MLEREAQAVEEISWKIYVFNARPTTTKQDVKNQFHEFGRIEEIRIDPSKNKAESRKGEKTIYINFRSRRNNLDKIQEYLKNAKNGMVAGMSRY